MRSVTEKHRLSTVPYALQFLRDKQGKHKALGMRHLVIHSIFLNDASAHAPLVPLEAWSPSQLKGKTCVKIASWVPRLKIEAPGNAKV